MNIIKSCFTASVHKSNLYKFDFIMSIAEGMTMLVSNLFFFSLLNQSQDDPYFYEQTLLPLFFQVFCGLFYGCFIDNITGLKYYINRGDLDWMIMKPTNMQIYISFRNINLGHIISSLFSVFLIFGVVLIHKIPVNFIDLLIASVFIIVALCGSYALLLGATSIAIMITTSGNISGLLLPVISLGRYPKRIFSKTMQYFVFIFFPSLISVDFSVSAFLGDWKISEIMVSLILVVIQLFIASKLFYKSLSYYSSSGS